MTILQIEYFVEIAKSGSFSKAAEKLFVTHQALTLQMQALEKELGFPLFDRRNKRKLKLLESGEILYQTWEPLLEKHRKAVLEAKSRHEGQMKTLRIGVQDAPKVREATISFIRDCLNAGNMKPEFIVGYPGPLLASL
ncbi:MAG: LysR family transcriptional regulator, partial [Lachnospiraceae bacterium]|nr:LysR family transcriptional regulator [Lachnospiraceae bacterium]